MANFKSWTVEWGLCSALGVHAPTPRSRAQPNSQLAYFPKPTIHPQQGCLPLLAAGMMTQLPINLGKRGAGQSQLPRLLFSSLSFHHSVSRGTGHKSPTPSPSLWFTTACALATQQNQPIGFPTRFDCPHGMVIGLGQWKGRGPFLSPQYGQNSLPFLAYISPISSSDCSTLSPLSRKINPFTF